MSAHKLVEKNSVENEKKIIRYDRFEVEPNTIFLRSEHITVEVINYSAQGILGYVPEAQQSHLRTNFQQTEFVLSVNGVSIQRINLDLASNVTLLNKIPNTFGFQILGEPLNIDRLRAIIAAEHIIKRMNIHLGSYAEVPIPFKMTVYEIKNWLQTLKHNIRAIEHVDQLHFLKDQNEFDHSVVECLATYLSQILPIYHQRLTDQFILLHQDAMKECLEFIRHEFKEIVFEIKQFRRTSDSTLTHIHPSAITRLNSINTQSLTFFHQAFKKYLASEPNLKTRDVRAVYFSQQISQTVLAHPGQPKILSFGATTANEIEMIFKRAELHPALQKNAEFHFVSQSADHLEQMKQDIQACARFMKCQWEFQFHPIEILDFIHLELNGFQFDLIYCQDFTHHLTDPMLRMIVQQLCSLLNQQGLLIAENFSNSHPHMLLNEAYYQNHCHYRSQQTLKELFSFAKTVQFESDADVTTWFAKIKNSGVS